MATNGISRRIFLKQIAASSGALAVTAGGVASPAAGRSPAVLGIPHGDGRRRGRLRSRNARGVHYRAGAPRRLHPARLTRSVSVISKARGTMKNEDQSIDTKGSL
jgi:hypothetical protein